MIQFINFKAPDIVLFALLEDAVADVCAAWDGGENDFGIQIFRCQHLFQPAQFADGA